jgi:hypothetical protein
MWRYHSSLLSRHGCSAWCNCNFITYLFSRGTCRVRRGLRSGWGTAPEPCGREPHTENTLRSEEVTEFELIRIATIVTTLAIIMWMCSTKRMNQIVSTTVISSVHSWFNLLVEQCILQRTGFVFRLHICGRTNAYYRRGKNDRRWVICCVLNIIRTTPRV